MKLGRLMGGVVLLVMAMFIFISEGYAQQKVRLRLASLWPPGDPPNTAAENLAKKFNSRVKGYEIVVFPSGQLAKPEEVLDAIRTKTVELGGFPVGVYASVDPRFAAAEVPLLYNGPEADAAAQKRLLPVYDDILTKRFNAKGVALFTCLGLELCSRKEVKKLSDWKGLLVHSVSPATSEFLQAMGASPVPMPFAEGYQAMQRKVVDGTMQSPQFLVSFKMWEVGKFATKAYLLPASIIYCVNLDVFRSMPPEVQSALLEAGAEVSQETNEFFVKAWREAFDTLFKNGMKIYAVPQEERERWRQHIQPAITRLFEKMGDFGKMVQNIAEEVNKEYPYKQ
ncbi:MAG: TRAP transporter substrate-binding protein DctP [candidate division WOR-3 bacterium]